MKFLALFLVLLSTLVSAQTPVVFNCKDVPAVTVSPGVILKELTGRTAPGSARSEKCSVAFFHLEPGRASAWSYNKIAEESFFVLKGRGKVWTGSHAQGVQPGSFILIPPRVVRSIRASQDDSLEFYAITSPAWSKDDDVLTTAPVGAPK